MSATGTSTAAPARSTHQHPARAARTALHHAAALAGLDPAGAQLLHQGRNFVFRLRGGVIAKVHHRRRYADVQRDARAAQALLAAGIPTAAPFGDGRPITAGGLVVSFTEDLGTTEPTWGQLAEAAACLHHIPPLAGLGLPLIDKITSAARRITLLPSSVISETERARLLALLTRTADAYTSITWPAPRTVHGDLNPGNGALLASGGTALLDLETLSIGHPGFDQAAAAFARDAFGLDPSVHEDWVDNYGYDITTAAGGLPYRTISMLLGISAYLFYAELGTQGRPEVLPQARHRLDTLLANRQFPWDWAPANPVRAAAAAGTAG
ncbi:phosphotransferase [Kitasatospora sp. NA04385]|uniref:phosphotransferase n=1 Tax=Kitasatospora sp. NA04385 TaxID=2742135 RepID=UPI001590CE44|nr:phosphotransferase [Kitasatospora sp. NA04385]QKW22284.1 phosphotransferase [Kitasatospora sp. NA04385]